MDRCEDFPCCGHQIGECPIGPAKPCPECGRMFEPCNNGSTYCLACGSRPKLPKFDMAPMLAPPQPGDRAARVKIGNCVECEAEGHLYWVRYGQKHENLCAGCADSYGQAAADNASDCLDGFYDQD